MRELGRLYGMNSARVLSTRYGTLQSFEVPDVPPIPITYTEEPEDEYVKEREEPAYRQLTRESDLQELAKETFDPDLCMYLCSSFWVVIE